MRRLPAEKVDGIIIRVQPLRDADQMLTVVTRERSKIAVLARNARRSQKRAMSTPDAFDCGLFEVRSNRGSHIPYLVQFIPDSSFHKLREDLDKLTSATLICESADLLIPEESLEDESIFYTLREGLSQIHTAKDIRTILRATHKSLASLLINTGYLDEAPPPSRNNITHLISTIENNIERKILSKEAFFSTLSQLKKSA